MGPPFIAMGFGLVVIAALFLVVIFFRAWRYPLIVVDSRYQVVITALMYGAAGVALWAANPLGQALGFEPMNGWLMFLASVLVFSSCAALIGSTAIGGTKTMLRWFIVAAVGWVVGILIWWYLL